jgi:hypothetical protein
MLQWIADNDHKAGETTVRDRASKLWRAIQKDGNSPLSARFRPTETPFLADYRGALEAFLIGEPHANNRGG